MRKRATKTRRVVDIVVKHWRGQPVRNTQDLEMPMNYDILLNGIVFSFTLWMSAKYLMTCGAAWSNLLQDLRKELA
jgi:hypothetical protein